MRRRSKQPVRQEFKPGPIGWARRRVLPQLARGSALLGVLILLAWITGRVLTDQHHWSQYLWWMPPLWAIGSAWLLLIVSYALAAMSRRLGGLMLRPLLLMLATGCTLFLVLGVWRVQRVLTRSDARAPGTIRVLHWNQAGQGIDQPAWGKRIKDMNANIVLIANAEWGESRQTLLEQFAYFAPDERVRWVNYSYRLPADPAHYRVEDSALIASRYPMTRTGTVSFGSSRRQQVLNHSSSERGWVMFAEFDLDPQHDDEPPFVVWFVDLPSNPLGWKRDEIQETKNAIDAWDGRGWTMGRHVWEKTTFDDHRLPTPDLVIGDFNTPRGSASLDLLAPGFRDAFAQAGHGRGRSFVIHDGDSFETVFFGLADIQIDLALTAPGIEVMRYELIHEDASDHAIQVVDLRLPAR